MNTPDQHVRVDIRPSQHDDNRFAEAVGLQAELAKTIEGEVRFPTGTEPFMRPTVLATANFPSG